MISPQPPFYWLTKYALTKGVSVVPSSECHFQDRTGGGQYLYHYPEGPHSYSTQYRPHEWHTSELDAMIEAERMRSNRLASLRKSIQQLEKKTIKIIDAARQEPK